MCRHLHNLTALVMHVYSVYMPPEHACIAGLQCIYRTSSTLQYRAQNLRMNEQATTNKTLRQIYKKQITIQQFQRKCSFKKYLKAITIIHRFQIFSNSVRSYLLQALSWFCIQKHRDSPGIIIDSMDSCSHSDGAYCTEWRVASP